MEKKNDKKSQAYSRRDFLKGMGTSAIGATVAPKLFAKDVTALQTQVGDVPLYSKKQINLTVNNRSLSLVVESHETLLYVLRERLNLTGTKRICDRGECGGCTVIMDGVPIYACMYLALMADGKNITTIEGLANGDNLHPIQQAFIDKDGYQCGYCTSGFIMTTAAFLEKNTNPSSDEIKEALSGNICRCGNYTRIFDSVSTAAQRMRR